MDGKAENQKETWEKGLSCAPGKDYTIFVAKPVILQISMWT